MLTSIMAKIHISSSFRLTFVYRRLGYTYFFLLFYISYERNSFVCLCFMQRPRQKHRHRLQKKWWFFKLYLKSNAKKRKNVKGTFFIFVYLNLKRFGHFSLIIKYLFFCIYAKNLQWAIFVWPQNQMIDTFSFYH